MPLLNTFNDARRMFRVLASEAPHIKDALEPETANRITILLAAVSQYAVEVNPDWETELGGCDCTLCQFEREMFRAVVDDPLPDSQYREVLAYINASAKLLRKPRAGESN